MGRGTWRTLRMGRGRERSTSMWKGTLMNKQEDRVGMETHRYDTCGDYKGGVGGSPPMPVTNRNLLGQILPGQPCVGTLYVQILLVRLTIFEVEYSN